MNRSSIIAYADDPITDSVHHPYTAYNQGFDAFQEGHPIERNPYDGRNGSWWTAGWRSAEEQEEFHGHICYLCNDDPVVIINNLAYCAGCIPD